MARGSIKTTTTTNVQAVATDQVKRENEKHTHKLDETEETPQSQPHLDCGYAWTILCVMFVLCSTTGGCTRVMGLIYARQVSDGYYDREQASWPIVTGSTIESLAGILTPALAMYLSWRQIQLLSSLLSIAAFVGAFFSNCFWLDMLTLGLVQGVALSMWAVISLAINNDYFDRFRTTAYGVIMSGGTCGLFYIGPAVSHVLAISDNFRYAYLVLACVFALNIALGWFIVPRASLLKEETTMTKVVTTRRDSVAPTSSLHKTLSRLGSKLERKNSIASLSIEAHSWHQIPWNRQALAASQQDSRCAPSAARRENSVMSLQHNAPIGQIAHALPSHMSAKGRRAFSRIESARDVADNLRKVSLAKRAIAAEANAAATRQGQPTASAANYSIDLTAHNTTQHHSSAVRRRSSRLAAPKQEVDAVDVAVAVEQDGGSAFTWANARELLKSPYLHIVWIMLVLNGVRARVMSITLVDQAQDHGLDLESASQLLNFYSIGEICGRIFLGSLIDLRWLAVRECVVLTHILLGSLFALFTVYASSYACAAAFTLAIAALTALEYMLVNVVMIEYVGKHKTTNCYSIAAFLSSFVLFTRPTMIGFFRDRLGSYDGLLLLVSLSSFSFALLFGALEPLIVRRWPKAAAAAAAAVNSGIALQREALNERSRHQDDQRQQEDNKTTRRCSVVAAVEERVCA